MHLRLGLFFGTACLLAFGTFGAGQSPAWKEFRSREGGYVTRFPGEPEKDSKTLKHRDGESTLILWSAKNDNGSLFAVGYVDFPAVTWAKTGPKRAIREMLQGLVAGASSKPTSEKDILLDKHLGVEFVVPFKAQGFDGVWHGRIYAVETRAYVLAVIGLKESLPDFKGSLPNPDEVRAFMGSFKLAPAKD